MKSLTQIHSRLRTLFGRKRFEAEMAAELRAHLEMQEAANRIAGMSADEAHYAARRQFGGVDQVKEQARDRRGWGWLERGFQDLRFGARLLAKAPGFTLVAVLTLGLGIGVNTGIFSAFKGIWLRPLPGVRHSNQLVTLLWTTRGGDQLTLSYPDLQDFQRRCRSFAGLEATVCTPFSLKIDGPAQRVWGEYATGGLHALLGLTAARGRLLASGDDRLPNGEPVVVLSYGCWQRRFGSDPGVIGRAVVLNGQSFTVVGVAPPGFAGTTVGFALDVFVPAATAGRLRLFVGKTQELFTQREFSWLVATGRLKPGVSLAEARAEIQVVGAALAREHPAEREGKTARLLSIRQSPFGAQTYAGPILTLLMGMTALVLLIMCANVANLLLARAAAREREMAVRVAMGGGRPRLVAQLVTESLLLAVLGGALGASLAGWTPQVLSWLWPSPRFPVSLNAEADLPVFLFTLAAAFGSALVFGLVPALQASKPDVLSALKGDGSTHRHRRIWGRNALVVAQIAISLPLLTAGGLLLRSYQKARAADFGFDPRHVALLSLDLIPNGYDAARGDRFYAELLDRIEALPGVESASLARMLPLGVVPGLQSGIEVEGRVRPPDEAALLLLNVVSHGYFRNLRIPILRGREFETRDTGQSVRVAIVNETMARRYWPGQDPLGRRFTAWGQRREVVGVARDIKYLAPAEEPRPHFYLPLTQAYQSEMVLQVRTTGDPESMFRALENQIAQLDPLLAVFNRETMEQYQEFALSLQSLAAGGLALASGLGLLLAAMGTYGVISYSVSQRTHEIGVRIALGANRAQILGLVMGQGLRLAAAGIGLGLAGALAANRFLKSLLFGIAPTDLPTFAVALLVVAAAAVAACWLPAKKATRVNPIEALKTE
jgi:predicted permease